MAIHTYEMELGRDAAYLRTTLMRNNNIELLIYLAKYNSEISRTDVVHNFGNEALSGIVDLEKLKLVEGKNNRIVITEKGIFQIEGLLSLLENRSR